ncbi:MAG: tryptophan-rich sensory protein [Acidobacteria bacterium]|nr:tryptophan-rich sensory protein [Acidobacteriota bacterium]
MGAFGSIVTIAQVDGWYASAPHVTWTPPNWAFGAVWTVLYLLIAVSGWLLWLRRARAARPVRRPAHRQRDLDAGVLRRVPAHRSDGALDRGRHHRAAGPAGRHHHPHRLAGLAQGRRAARAVPRLDPLREHAQLGGRGPRLAAVTAPADRPAIASSPDPIPAGMRLTADGDGGRALASRRAPRSR